MVASSLRTLVLVVYIPPFAVVYMTFAVPIGLVIVRYFTPPKLISILAPKVVRLFASAGWSSNLNSTFPLLLVYGTTCEMVWLVNASVASAAVLLLNIHPAIAVQLLSPVAKSPLLIILLQVVIGFGMRIDSFAVAVPPLLSEMVYGNWTRPIYPLVGTKVKNPVLDDITVPHVTAMDCVVPELIVTPLIVVIVSVCPSASLSPESGESETGVFAGVV
jgi:hypothetical protein